MIGHFPVPYPDELLFSTLARLYRRLGKPCMTTFIEYVYRNPVRKIPVFLPRQLGCLVNSLPPGLHTIDELVDNHTLLPVFLPFLPDRTRTKVRNGVVASSGASVFARVGMISGPIAFPRFLRYCPACVEADRETVGEAYWHRLHQVPGVHVCCEHNVFLENSNVEIRSNVGDLVTPDDKDAITARRPRRVSSKDPDHCVLFNLADDVRWILANKPSSSIDQIRASYRHLLAERGLASKSGGTVDVLSLTDRFKGFYTDKVLRLLECEIPESVKTNWLVRMTRSLDKAIYAVRHLLFIRFLGLTAEQFFNGNHLRRPFGDGPWSCLNPAVTS